MLRIKFKKKPYWIELSYGVKVKVRPLDTQIYFEAKVFMSKKILDLKDSKNELLFDDEKKLALIDRALTCGLAKAGIIDWYGLVGEDAKKDLKFSPENLDEVFNQFWFLAETFRNKYTDVSELLEKEKKDLGLAFTGTSGTGRTSVEVANKIISPAQGEKGGKTGSTAPTRKANSKRLKGGRHGK